MAEIITELGNKYNKILERKTNIDWNIGIPEKVVEKVVKVGIGGTKGKRKRQFYCAGKDKKYKYAAIKEVCLTEEDEKLRKEKNINVSALVRMIIRAKKVIIEY